MGFFDTVTPTEMEAGRMLGLLTMATLIGVGFVPPLRPYAHRIRLATAGIYLLGIFCFTVYFVAFR
jgi:hypothetical protein